MEPEERKEATVKAIKLCEDLKGLVDKFKKETGLCPKIEITYLMGIGCCQGPQTILFRVDGFGIVSPAGNGK